MRGYILTRLLLAVVTFLGITAVSFGLIHLVPGDPAAAGPAGLSDSQVTPEVYAQLRARYHLDKPLLARYGTWLAAILRGDLGRSFRDGRLVTERIGERLGATLGLVALSQVAALLIAVPLGVEAARRAGGLFDRALGLATYGLYAVPRYVMALVLIVVVGVRLGWLPFLGATSDDYATLSAAGRLVDWLQHAVLIGMCLTYPLAAYQVRFVRAGMIAVLAEPFILSARAHGLSERRIAYGHALPNTLLPLLTLVGLMLPGLLSGTVVLEVIFSWPGLGRLMYEAVMQRDYPVVMGLTVVTAAVVLVGTLLVDLLYTVADPRVRCRP